MFILALRFQRVRVYNGKDSMAAGGWSRKLADHILSTSRTREYKLKGERVYKLLSPAPSDVLPPVRLHLIKAP